MDDADVADVEALGESHGDILERLTRQCRMVVEYDGIDRIALLRLRAGKADEGDDRAVAAGGLGQLGKLELRVEDLRLEQRDDTHPPETGGRESTASASPIPPS